MTNGEDEIGGNQVPNQESVQPSKVENEMDGGQIPYQEPAEPKKKSSNPVIIVVAILAVCCIGSLILVFSGIVSLDFTLGPQYTNETVGNHVFKIPVGYEKKTGGGEYTEFRNDSNKFIKISSIGTRLEVYAFALVVSSELDGLSGYRMDINGTPAYRFDTVDTGASGQSVYLYAMNIQGDNYLFMVSKGIQDPDDFLLNVTST